MNTVVLLLGSNVGDRLSNLKSASDSIGRGFGTISKVSSVYETEPWGNIDQNLFLNLVMVIESPLQADEMIRQIILLEEKMGRVRTQKWASRIIDIDILFFNQEIISEEHLVVPHPELHARKFTLIPLAELMPGYVHPVLKKTVSELLSQLNDPLAVKKYSDQLA